MWRSRKWRKKETLGADAYYKINADAEQRHRDKLQATIGADEYKKQQADYMKAYRAKQRQLKQNVGTKQNNKAISTLTDAIRARKAKKELLSLAIESANKTANKFSEIDKTSHLSQLGTVGNKLLEIGDANILGLVLIRLISPVSKTLFLTTE